MDNHDVAKHRQAVFSAGRLRDDPPPGFFERLGIAQDEMAQILVTPMAQVLLPKAPKTPLSERPAELDHWTDLEGVEQRIVAFICEAVCLSARDAAEHIALNEKILRDDSVDG